MFGVLVDRLRPVAALALALTLVVAATASAQKRPEVEPKVINGAAAAPGEYPWQVALVTGGQPASTRQFCGGTLVAPRIVITAAHCVVGGRPTGIDVVTGVVDLTDPATAVGQPNRQDVVKIAVHPFGDADDDDPFASPRRDIAALWLSADAGPGAQPIAIGTDTDLASAASLRITGWGNTSATTDAYPDIMQWADVEPLDDADCLDAYGEYFSATDMVCASGATPDGDLIDTCQGDSGGPLAAGVTDPLSPTGVTLVGVTSFGYGCADPDFPGVYSRITAPLLRTFATDAAAANGNTAAGPLEQPYWQGVGGVVPVVGNEAATTAEIGDTLECYQSTNLAWGGAPDTLEYFVRRDEGDAGYTTVSTSPVYEFAAGDAGKRFVCELRARRSGAGGYGVVRSVPVTVQTPAVEPPPTVTVEVPGPTVTVPVEVPGPTQTVPVPVPGPTVTVPGPPPPRVEDSSAPRVSQVRRACTKKRVCTFTATVTDAAPSAGVKQVTGTLASTTTRRCTKGGRRTTCSSTRFAELRGTARGTTATLRSKALAKGRHVLTLLAVDGAGNVQETPKRTRFTLK